MNIMIAGGGTGGHLFPGIAIAEEFLTRDTAHNILFVGTERGLEKKILGNMGFSLRTLHVEGVKGRGIVKALSALLKIPRSLIESRGLIREFSPDIVIGVGGYSSGPTVLTAWCMGIKTAIAEQNAMPGITNRILGKFVDRIFLTFPETMKCFPGKKTIITGNPIRAGFVTETHAEKKAGDKFTLLIFGGSQGAHSINMAVLDALPYLRAIVPALKIIHQTGEKDLRNVSDCYRSHGVEADVLPFIMDIAKIYRSSNLLICRAGATSIAELTASGKAAILIPFPDATGDHQTKNAEALLQAGACVMIRETELSGKKLAETIADLYDDPARIREIETRSAGLGNPRAAAQIVDACREIIPSKKI
jgi:UDP-N-acetylglucosamine--N-acetylmuramyl-(pentapeptide) pyrophosphoryl-undecaprenol N-acetylglucosamine transferase